VVYREDACRVRKDYSQGNRVQQMAWSEDYFESLLFRSDFASVQEAS
jgi:hypothetical protein